jgi:hypothetical protein
VLGNVDGDLYANSVEARFQQSKIVNDGLLVLGRVGSFHGRGILGRAFLLLSSDLEIGWRRKRWERYALRRGGSPGGQSFGDVALLVVAANVILISG